MENNALPGLIKKVLGSPHSEQAIKAQIIQLASQNLHLPEVTTALLEVLPLTADKETRNRLLGLLSSLDTSRFSDTTVLFDALLDVYTKEQDRDTRNRLLQRLQQSVHQDPRLAGFFIELSAQDSLSEPERLTVQQALNSLPGVSPEIAIKVLAKNLNAPNILQAQAVQLAEKCSSWGPELTAALQPYLDPKTASAIRGKVVEVLVGRIGPDQLLDTILHLFRNEPNGALRELLFNQLKPLSMARHPELVQIFAAELIKRASPFRTSCAGILAKAAEQHSQIPAALEDVMLSDNDRELLRLSLDGYLRPGVQKRFDPLLAVAKNEAADISTRQKALDAILKLPPTQEEARRLEKALTEIKPGILKTN